MMNPMNLIQMLKGGNPAQMLMGMLRQQANNPVISNAINMAEKHDAQGLEKLARNLCESNGINADDMVKQIKSQFGMK